MKTKYRISTAAFLAAASLTFSTSAWSLGLGDVTVESYLNQPLQVKIDLITRETDDLAAVKAQLASADDYELIGASRDTIPVPIRFTVEDPEGEPYLLGTSNLPLGTPVVRLIVEVTYASGRLLREYTVFLDPPTHSAQAPIPRVDKRKNPPVAEPAPAPVPVPVETASETPVETEQPATAATPASSAPAQPGQGEYGPVANGETLWGIAKNWSRGTGMDMNKVMIAIQRENPGAFLRGNINLLKRGAILRMPRAEDVRNISTASAISEVSAQTEQFRGSKSSATVTSPSTPLLADETDEEIVKAETELADTVTEEAPAEPGQEPLAIADSEPQVQDQLELVPPSQESDLDSTYGFEESDDDPADATVSPSALREDLARTEEELITQQQQNEYLEERIRELEAQLADADKANVEDTDMANMEERLRQERQQQATSQQADESWYGKFSVWLIGLLVLVAAVAGWFLSRRGGTEEFVSDVSSEEEQLKEIKDEAEEVLRVLEEPDEPAEQASEEQTEDTGKEVAEETPGATAFGAGGDDAEVLDEESSDPEIQLDLARAYISMGDKEAARVILEEVQNSGSETQRDEARKMLDLLVS
jgi:pilus assembly protein FimV